MRIMGMFAAALAAASLFVLPAAHATDDRNHQTSVTVAFGVGMNTAQPGNSANHHVLPDVVKLKLGKSGGVVHFAVAGFHQVFVYKPGKLAEHVAAPAAGLFINDFNDIYYQGIMPAVPPEGAANPSNALNRVESVGFFEPGIYLVICNITPHFVDGMYAYVHVTR